MEDALYQVLESYIPEPNDIIGLAVQKDDYVLIFPEKTSFQKGRAYAINPRTRETGYIPLDIVKHLETSGKESFIASNPELSRLVNRTARGFLLDIQLQGSDVSHVLANYNVLNPVLCIHCVDYIWGTSKILVKCAAAMGYHDAGD